MEQKRTRKCGYCKKTGHNVLTCEEKKAKAREESNQPEEVRIRVVQRGWERGMMQTMTMMAWRKPTSSEERDGQRRRKKNFVDVRSNASWGAAGQVRIGVLYLLFCTRVSVYRHLHTHLNSSPSSCTQPAPSPASRIHFHKGFPLYSFTGQPNFYTYPFSESQKTDPSDVYFCTAIGSSLWKSCSSQFRAWKEVAKSDSVKLVFRSRFNGRPGCSSFPILRFIVCLLSDIIFKTISIAPTPCAP